jgi:hypothetical protein
MILPQRHLLTVSLPLCRSCRRDGSGVARREMPVADMVVEEFSFGERCHQGCTRLWRCVLLGIASPRAVFDMKTPAASVAAERADDAGRHERRRHALLARRRCQLAIIAPLGTSSAEPSDSSNFTRLSRS